MEKFLPCFHLEVPMICKKLLIMELMQLWLVRLGYPKKFFLNIF